MRKICLVFVVILGLRPASAQHFGGNPPSMRWMQINTDTVRVIFPRGLGREANRVARYVTYVSRHNRMSIGSRERKTPIVLENRLVESNGFVTLSPFHAVFQLVPPADNFSLGSLDFTTLLSLHEYRHALQNMNFRTGIGRTFYDLFGENGQAVATGALIPDWFWEGDAVFMETALSDQGRGRLPAFLEPFRSLHFAGKYYRYAKIRNGSFRDMVPDHYPLGYMMTAYGRDTLGPYFWEMATQQALVNRKFIGILNKQYPERPYHSLRYGIYPLSSALHYLSGVKIPGFYERALSFFARRWDSTAREQQYTPVDTLQANRKRSVLSYRYPHVLPDGSILAIKHGYGHTSRIVRIAADGTQSVVVRLGNIPDDYFSFGGGKLVWREVRPDARWGWRDYSVLRLYDTATRTTRTLSRHSRYFSAALSSDGQRVAAVEVTGGGDNRLVILEATTGRVLKHLSGPPGWEYTYPVFTADGRALVAAVRDVAGRMAFARLPLDGSDPQLLTPFWMRTLGPPVLQGATIFFPADFSGNIQLYGWKRVTGQLWSLASRPLGDYSIAVDTPRNRLVFDEYSAGGYLLASIPLDTARWQLTDTTGLSAVAPSVADDALRMEGGPVTGRVPPRSFPVTSYRPGGHLFRIHSWSFLPTYPEVGLFLQSQDVLNTLQWTAGGGYNVDEQTPFASASVAYGGWFPVFSAGYKRMFHRTGHVSGQPVAWNESDASVGVSIPLTLSANRYGRALTLGGQLHRNTLNFDPSPALKTLFTRITYLEGAFSFSNGLLRSRQQVYPAFGQSVSVDFKRSLGTAFAQQLTVSGNLFLPGLFRNHSLLLSGDYGVRDARRQYRFSDNFHYASGYSSVPYREIHTLGVHYQLPVAYPDWGTTWAYLSRIRADAFFTATRAHMLPGVTPHAGTYRSAGGTLYLDTRIFNALSIPWGIRYSWLLDRDFSDPGRRGQWQLVVPLTFF